MNKIHKVIWSRCSNAFVVVSELARSRSAGGSTRSANSVERPAPLSPLTALATSVALAFGLNAPVWAIEGDVPGGSVVQVGPGHPAWVNGTDVKNTAYGNALQINSGAGEISIKGGGTISVEPTNPRAAGDTTPYAAIWVKTRDTTDDKTTFEYDWDPVNQVQVRVQAKVEGDHLHGVHVEHLGWLQASSLDVTAIGDDTTGLHSDGQVDLRNITIDVAGNNAKGVYIGSQGSVHFSIGDQVTISGSDAVGVDVAGGLVHAGSANGYSTLTVDVKGVAGSDATGIRFNNGRTTDDLKGIIVAVNNTDGKNTTGILLGDLATADKSITFGTSIGPNDLSTNTKITVVGNADADVTDASTRGIDVREGLTVNLIGASVDVSGARATGIRLAEGATAVLDDSQINAISIANTDSSWAVGVSAEKNSTLVVNNDSQIIAESKNAAGIVLRERANADLNNAVIDVNVDNAASYSKGTGISAGSGGALINIVDSKINVGTIDASDSKGIHLESGANYVRGTGTISNTQITINGKLGKGIFTRESDITIDGDSKIAMSGDYSHAISLDRYSNATISNTTFEMHGLNSVGLSSQDSITAISDTTITMNGNDSSGLLLGWGTDTTLNSTTINTNGSGSVGIQAGSGSETTVNGGKLKGAGSKSGGVLAEDGAIINLAGTNITLNGDNSVGVQASNDGTSVSFDNVKMDVQGDNVVYGLHSDDKATANISNGTTIKVTSDSSAYGIDSNNGATTRLDNVTLDIDGKNLAYGVTVFNASELNTSNGTNIVAKSSNQTARGIYADDNAKVTLADTVIDVEGRIAVAVAASTNSELTILGGNIKVKGLSGSEAIGGSTSTSKVKLEGTTVSAQGIRGTGWDSYDDTQFVMSNSTIEYTGDQFGNALKLGNVQDAQIVDNSVLSSVGNGNGNTAMYAYDGSKVHIADSRLYAANNNAAAWVTGLDIDDQSEVTVVGSTIEVSGNEAYAVHMFGDQSVLNTSGQTRLVSSHDTVLLESTAAKVVMTDTELVAGGNTFTAALPGNDTLRIDLGVGVVATANNGTLLSVERNPGVPTGRVELNIADGAKLAGAIIDDATNLASLTADGGTHLSVSNAQYSGKVQNIRSVTLANAARIGGGTVTTPNTVLEDIQVSSGATLAGNWKVGGTLHAANGRIAPGNSIGVISTDSINWGPGTILEVEVNAAGESDRVEVTGAAPANIGNTALQVMQEDGTGGYRLDHNYTILTAAGGISGEFTEANWQGGELIRINPFYGPNQIGMSLSVNQQALAAANLTSNQRATSGGALSVAGLNPAADAAFLSTDPAASFDLLSGEIHPSTRAGLMNSSTLLSNAVLGRLRDRSSAQAGAGTGTPAASQYPLWVSYTHNQQTAKGDSNTARRKHKIDSFALGGDAQVGAGWNVGGAFAYTNSDIRLNERKSSSDIDSYSLALYAGKSWETGSGALNFMAGLGHTWHDINTRRNVDLGGSQSLKASYDARSLQLFGELGYAMPLGERSTVEPYLGVTWLQHRTDGFSENGGPAALKGASGTDDITFSTLGLRAGTTIEAGKTVLNLNAGLGWRHAFGDQQPGAKLSFIQGGGNAFTVVGAPIARNTAVFNLGTEVQVGRHTTIGLGYEGQAGSGFSEHAGNLYLKTRF